MDQQDQFRIREKLPFLLQHTGNLEVLLALLYSVGVLSRHEKELIESKTTSYGKNEEVFSIVCTKGAEAFQKLIDCLRNSENGHVADELVSPSHSSILKEKPLWFDVVQSVPLFSGREEELQKLRDYWQKNKQSQSQQFTIISGLGGIGKSELARVHATSFYETEQGNCIWIFAETEESLLSSFRRLAENSKVNVKLTDHNGKDKGLKKIASDIFSHFRNKKCLVIFDNVAEYTGSLQNILQPLASKPPGETRPFILITTRFRKLKDSFGASANHIELDVLTPESSTVFLINSLNLKNEEQRNIAKVLSETLQYFPLALQQAVPFIKDINETSFLSSNQMLSIEEYLAIFENQKKSMLDFPLPVYRNLNSFSQTTFITWKVTLEKIQAHPEIGCISRDIMHIISFFSADGIDVEFLLAILPDYLTFQDALEQTESRPEFNVKYNLISVPESCSENILRRALLLPSQYSMYNISEKKIHVHRLVQEVTRLELEEQNKIKSILIILLELFVVRYSLNHSVNSIDQVVHLWDHAAQVTEIVNKFKCFPQLILNIMQNERRYNEALLFANKVLETFERILGHREEETMVIKGRRGVILLEKGMYAPSLKDLQEVEAELKKFKDTEHIDLLQLRQHIASALLCQGNFTKALSDFKQLNEIQERTLGIEHTYTLKTKETMALALLKQGNNDEALLLYEEVYKLRQEILGKEHPDTLGIRSRIATVLLSQGNNAEALSYYNQVNEIQERTLDTEHPQTLNTKSNMALTMCNLGNYKEALSLNKEVYGILEQTLGKEHPHTLTSKNNMALVHCRQGNLDKAMTVYIEVNEIQNRTLGMNHPDALTSKDNMAVLLGMKGNYAEALSIHEEVYRIREQTMGMQHPLTLSTKMNMARTLRKQGKLAEAMLQYNEVNETQEKTLGIEHPQTLCTKEIMASVLMDQGKYADAMLLYKQVNTIQERTQGIEHPETLLTKSILAAVLCRQGCHSEALSHCKQLIEIQKRTIGKQHAKTISAMNTAAVALHSSGNHYKALTVFKSVYKKRRKTLGMEHPGTLCTKSDIAGVLRTQGHFSESLSLLREVYVIQRRALGISNPDTLKTKDRIDIVLQSIVNSVGS